MFSTSLFAPVAANFGLLARGGIGGGRFLIPLLLLFLLGGLATLLVLRRRGGSVGNGSAMQSLQDRFARGEIDRDEFEHRKAVLVGADVVPPMSGATDGPANVDTDK